MKVVINKDNSHRKVKAYFSDGYSRLVFPNECNGTNTCISAEGKAHQDSTNFTAIKNLKGFEPIYEGDSITITF